MNINAISLFSSAGIGELSLHKGNLTFVAANELLEKRANTYKFFFPNTKMFQGDIIDKSLRTEMINFSIEKNVKFLLATPPCQGLSSVGKNKHQNHFIKDRRNFLVMEIFEYIDKLDLDFILIENVPRFLNMYFPYGNEFLLLEDILNLKYGKDYKIDIKILNAKDYGICQSRPRAIIKMYKHNIKWPWPTMEEEIPLEKAIGHLPSLEPGENSGIKWHIAKNARHSIIEALRYTKPGTSAIKNEFYYPKKDNGERIKGFHNTYKRMVWDKPAPARTTYSGSISSHNNVHPGRLNPDGTYSDPRVLTLLETFIVSSIDSKIDFPEDATETYIRTIIGEAIPPKLLEKICFPEGGKLIGRRNK
ncbi:DNA cytosine methyltransferase [Mammaliicoccus sciuri]|uniref:DNA cytosine methyltransferase n=1 Tax=Mammaliicoccus sciuri TaxID=1296 RepID=UPI0008075C57|nr:DNA cytosine methyltransferase [Mammaliicoccus sciuri]MBU6089365.1 DNA cytosine methyltransferase [Mammaliicoccus sciuri]MBW3109352.1 DNA cytosine methyltransferase [Mammaliicoccus sciuri]MCH5140922.1 DNA cytosine methyltransferase [Mammaliicoccus sciuri]MEB6263889.1 DNA cytosine methyltransferase [Mammaliicoccus sciuri]MEB8072680.1 DNA cytosine methyltransferase [Mammaliicoccus sciuri]